MSEEINVRKVALAGLFGGFFLVVIFNLILGFSLNPVFSIFLPIDLIAGVALVTLVFYAFFVAPTLFVVSRLNVRLSVAGAFLIGFLQSLLVLLMYLPWSNILFSRLYLLPLVSGIVGVFIAWFGGFLRTTSGMPSP